MVWRSYRRNVAAARERLAHPQVPARRAPTPPPDRPIPDSKPGLGHGAGGSGSTPGAARALVPTVAAVFAFAVSFGALAVSSGLPAAAAVVMSATTFGGAAQFAAVTVLGAGGGVAAAVLAGALLNIRYLPMGAAAAAAYTGRPWRRASSAQLLGDEAWALARREEGYDPRVLLQAGALIWLVWTAGTALGAFGLGKPGQAETWGLDMASPAIFLALLWQQLSPRSAAVAAVAAGLALALVPVAPAGIPITVAAAACLLGIRQ